jgi:hypothetical protein
MENKKKSLWTKAEKLMFIGGGIALLVIIAWAFFLFSLQSRLDNKLVELRKKGILTNWDELAEWYESQPVDPATNQAYQDAFQAYVPLEQSKMEEVFIEGIAPLFPDEKLTSKHVFEASQKYLDSNKKALELLHKAAKLKNCRFPVDFRKGPRSLMPHLNKFRSKIRLLAMEAVFAASKGDSETCFKAFKDSIKISKTLNNEPILISYWENLICIKIIIADLQWCLGRIQFNDEQYKKLSKQLQEKFISLDKHLKIAFSGDVAMSLDKKCINSIYKYYPSWQEKFLPVLINLSGIGTANRLKYAYEKALTAIDKLENKIRKLNRLYYRYVNIAFITRKDIIRDIENFRIEVQATITGLAVERFKLKYHRLPDTLEELVPEFLAEVPVDSYQANNSKLKYLKVFSFEYDKPVETKTTTTSSIKTTIEKVKYPGYTVYSIGEDKIDQHGYWQNKWKKSDIIWGVMARGAKPIKSSK